MPKAPPWRPRVATVRITVAVAVTLGGFVLVPNTSGAATAVPTGQPVGSPIDLPLGAAFGGPAALVDPEAGTGIGTVTPGNVSEYPGASVPLGMVQFSPDTSPDRQVATGSGYDYADDEISGFSLTHLSGPGCAIYGDIPILPLTGPVPANPDVAVQPFAHTSEHSSAGNYGVTLGSVASQDVGVRLTATTRSALGAFDFPGDPASSAGVKTAPADDLLFKVSDSANGSSSSQVQVIGSDRLVGAVTSGNFCGIPGDYTLHFAAQFSEPFAASGTWQNGTVGARKTCTGTVSASCGAWVSFQRPGHGRAHRILVKVGISFVSAAGAATNLAAEDPGWSFSEISRAATEEWNGLLGRVAIRGGSATAQRTFYTALYHSLLFPSVFSDDDGQYAGFDHRIHTLTQGHVQYSNISEADIYRSEVPLLAVLLPGPTSQMVQSLLNDADQTPGGFLPKWVIADNDASQWDGDSADPIIANAYAFGARGFDVKQALTAMVHGATVPENGFAERQNLEEYLSQGWVSALTYDITSYPYTDGGSETLEYSLDDFSIAQLARAAGEHAVAATFGQRGQNWQNLFNPATGYLAARQADGSFPPGPAFQLASPADQAQGVAQQGFEEGNAIQYSWAVPQDLAGLIGLMGGDHAAVAKLDTFFTRLNATRFEPFDWAGNEPGEWIPFEYDYAGAPFETQSVVRRIMTQLYPLAPAAEPGEDDLGALSSWFVWAALGLYPETPGTASLVMTSPLFPAATILEGNGHTLTITGSHAPDPYIERARLALGSAGSSSWDRPWLPSTALSEGAHLSVDLGRAPNPAWGASASSAPPSFSRRAAPAVPFSTPGGALRVPLGGSAVLQFGVQEASRSTGSTATEVVSWRAAPSVGVTVSPASGTLGVVDGRSTTPLRVTSARPGTSTVTFDLTQAGTPLPGLTLDVLS